MTVYVNISIIYTLAWRFAAALCRYIRNSSHPTHILIFIINLSSTGLAAVVFTSVSLVNGCASLYAYELRKCIPGILSKLTHICFGTVAFVMASVCLCYGIDKGSFRNALSTRFADSLIIMTGTLTTIVIINPLLTFYVKFSGAIKN